MKKHLILILIASQVGIVHAMDSAADKQKMTDKMISACKMELAKDPALSDTSDSEMVWKNLEDKEHAKMKLSKKCNMAHEKYEHKFHKEQGEQSETH